MIGDPLCALILPHTCTYAHEVFVSVFVAMHSSIMGCSPPLDAVCHFRKDDPWLLLCWVPLLPVALLASFVACCFAVASSADQASASLLGGP